MAMVLKNGFLKSERNITARTLTGLGSMDERRCPILAGEHPDRRCDLI